MTDRQTLRRALYDAIEWRQSYAESWSTGEPERVKAEAQVAEYRRLLLKRYGDDRTPGESRMKNAKLVSIFEIVARPIADEPKSED